MSSFPALITDRTQSDVMYAYELAERIKRESIDAIPPEERDEWFAGLRGRYTITDLNRVESAVSIMAELLNSKGFTVNVSTRSWSIEDIPSHSDMERYLSNVRALIDAFFTFPETPPLPPSMERLGYNGANAIEQILNDIYTLFNNMTVPIFYLGDIYSGDV